MICFQTYIFVILNTAKTKLLTNYKALWFAFKLISLSYWIQPGVDYTDKSVRCDLLSNLYLCHIEYSSLQKTFWTCFVVICFQTYIFVILNTAIYLRGACLSLLWFAFKLISLSYWIQQAEINATTELSCDLLSNLYLCHIEYSKYWEAIDRS